VYLVECKCLKALSGDGGYQVQLPGWANQVRGPNQWAACTGITLTVTGMADG